MKKFYILTLLILVSLMIPFSCKAAMSVYPLELWITMDDEFINGNTSKKIMVTNNDEFSVNISWYIDHPSSDLMRTNKTNIPSLYYVSIEPYWRIAHPGDTVSFYIHLDIPEGEDNLNQNWEIWPTFKQNKSQGVFKFEQAVRLYVNTPSKLIFDDDQEQEFFSIKIGDQINISLYDIAIVAVIIVFLIIGILIVRKNKS